MPEPKIIKDFPTQGYWYRMKGGDILGNVCIAAYGDWGKWKNVAAVNNIPIGNKTAGDEYHIPIGTLIFIPGEVDDTPPAVHKAPPNRAIGKPKGAVTLVIDGRIIPVPQGRFACSIDEFCRLWNCEIPWVPGKDPWLDKHTARWGAYPDEDIKGDSELYLGSELVAIGGLYSRTNSGTASTSTKTLEFFSRTADLVDSTLFPSQTEIVKSDLKQIADIILKDTGTPYYFLDGYGGAFDNVQRKDAITVAAYFQHLAANRGLFVTTDEHGCVIFQKLKTDGKPVANIEYGVTRNATEYSVKFDDRLRFGKYVSGLLTAGGKEINTTCTDPTVPGSRQLLFAASDVNVRDNTTAAAWYMLRISLEALSFQIPVSTWYDDAGRLWVPNSSITLKAPILDVPEPKSFITRGVEFAWAADSRSAMLSVIPPLTVDDQGNLQMGGV
ncbi:hypothetical protein FACS1894110_09930 [Spirochaetia bacterium]|nr:hypothetical protein FACS1894110_09930 [Spirochaetia bacterium]